MTPERLKLWEKARQGRDAAIVQAHEEREAAIAAEREAKLQQERELRERLEAEEKRKNGFLAKVDALFDDARAEGLWPRDISTLVTEQIEQRALAAQRTYFVPKVVGK